jgi:general secretion pathway protein D
MFSSHRLTFFALLLFSFALTSRSLPAKKTPKPDKELSMAIEAEHTGDFDTALALIDSAMAKKPGDLAYQIASYRIHFEAAAAHVHHAIRVRNGGNLTEALAELEKAVEIDPSSDTARQEVRRTKLMIERAEKGEGGAPPPEDSKETRSLTPAELERKRESDKFATIMGVPELKALNPDPINLKMVNQTPKVLFDTVGKVAGGINVIFDPDYQTQNTIKQQSIDLVNASLNEALDDVAVVTKSYWKPLGPNTIFVTLDNRQKRQEYEEQVVKVFYLQNVGQQAELNEAVTVLRTVADIQKIFTSTPMNAIIIRAAADKIPLAEKLIAAIDKPKSEVVVDIMVMEVSRNYMRNLSAAIGVGGINSPITFTPRSSLTGQATTTTTTSATGGTTTTSNANTTTNNNTLLLPKISHISSADYTISNVPGGLIEALLSDSSTKVLQAPQMRALDNFKSSLKVGEKIPTATGSFQPGVGGVGINPLVNTQFTYLDVGVNVDMLPRVNSATEVSAHISVEVSQESGTVNLGGIDQPVIGQRRVEMDLRMRDGEINLIGGLIRDENDKSISGIPGLGNIPGIGNLFKSTNVTKTQDELLIVMVPHIIRSPDITEEDLRAIATGNETSYRLSYAPPKPAAKPQAAPAPAVPSGAAPAPTAPPATAPAITPPTPQASPQAQLTPPATAPPVPQPTTPAVAPPPAAAPVSATFTPTQTELSVGATVPISIQVNNVNDLAALQMSLKFDPKILHINNLTSGDLIKRNGPDLMPSRNILNDSGTATIGLVRDPSSGGVSGSGAVLTIVFQAVGKGATTVTAPQFTMTGAAGQSIPTSAPVLTINVK